MTDFTNYYTKTSAAHDCALTRFGTPREWQALCSRAGIDWQQAGVKAWACVRARQIQEMADLLPTQPEQPAYDPDHEWQSEAAITKWQLERAAEWAIAQEDWLCQDSSEALVAELAEAYAHIGVEDVASDEQPQQPPQAEKWVDPRPQMPMGMGVPWKYRD